MVPGVYGEVCGLNCRGSRLYVVVALGLVLTVALAVCWAVGARLTGRGREAEISDILMDTFIIVRATGPGAAGAAAEALDEFRRLDRMLNAYNDASEIAAINREAGDAAVKVSPETLDVVERAVQFASLSGGAFDPTILPLINCWGFSGGNPRVPDPGSLSAALALVDYKSVIIDRSNSTVRLARKGMGLDLGGIAKGYATDRAARILRARGITSAIIDAGGNVYALGHKPGAGRPAWIVGIQDPRKTDSYLVRIGLVDETAVTSGDYQRFFISNGVRYHHILDPATGYPPGELIQTTIIGPSSTDADALSTAVFVLGETKGLELVRSLEGTGAFIVRADGSVASTENIRSRLDFSGTKGK